MPRLWDSSIDAHRKAVVDAILDTTGQMVHAQGLTSVTMSAIAEGAGIGRATLYKYYSDVDSVIAAWHEREVGRHLQHLIDIRETGTGPVQQLRAVLNAYAMLAHQQPGSGVSVALHRRSHAEHAEQQVRQLLQELIADAVKTGCLRDDLSTRELAEYCISALAAAAHMPQPAAVHRLVEVTIAGMRKPPKSSSGDVPDAVSMPERHPGQRRHRGHE